MWIYRYNHAVVFGEKPGALFSKSPDNLQARTILREQCSSTETEFLFLSKLNFNILIILWKSRVSLH